MTTLQDYIIGFIGLGLMGSPMCLNLHRAGAHMIVYNRSPEAMNSITRDGH